MAYKVFTNGSVLQASEINANLMNQSVMVFTNASARTAALTSPVEGMLTWREDSNVYEYYNGSAWVQLVTPSGYDLIKTQAIGTNVGSFQVTGAFSSTYDSYKIIISGGAASTEVIMALKIGSASSLYYQTLVYSQYSGGSPLAAIVNNGSIFTYAGSGNTGGLNLNVNVDSPFLSKNTVISGQMSRILPASYAGAFQGYIGDTNSYTTFDIGLNTGLITGGTCSVYGYRK